MQPGALAPYEHSLVSGLPLHLRHADGQLVQLEVDRWLAPADTVDLDVVRRTVSPVLDVGCGPGRIVAALTENGRFALGIDIAPTAVRLTRDQGLNALRADVFGRVPGERRWGTVLLLDGNIGIGGDLDGLLLRTSTLLAPAGTVVVETHLDPHADETHVVRFVLAGEVGRIEFPWRYVGIHALRGAAHRCGLVVTDEWALGDRTFARLSIASARG